MVQGSTSRQLCEGSEEQGTVLSEALGTEVPSNWPELVREANDLLHAYLEKHHPYLRAHREICSSMFRAIRPDTWGDTQIRGLDTLELKCGGITQQVSIPGILYWDDLLSAGHRNQVFRTDPSVWFYCEFPELTLASEDEYPEWDWIQANEAWLREKYAGLWIAVRENAMVAVAGSEVEVLKEADEGGYEDVFTFYVPTESEPAVVVVAA